MYLCIDLKCFYASVECIERNLDPQTTPLVVADPSRSKGAICLAITPYLKNKGIRNRCRLYEIPETIYYKIVPPRMKKYIEYSAKVYGLLLNFIAKEDIHVYSIDECFIDIKPYLHLYQKTAQQMGKELIDLIEQKTKLIATCGVGTNLYLAKIALDLIAKKNSSRIAYLNEPLYKEKLWNYQPLSDFWQIGNGIEKRLHRLNIYTMKDLAFANKKRLENEFKSAWISLYEHAWGKENTTMQDIKNYQTKNKSLSSGQTLMKDYSYMDAKLVLTEMTELLVLDLVTQKYVTDHISLSVSYSKNYAIPSTKASKKLDVQTNSYSILKKELLTLFKQNVNQKIPIRKIRISFSHLLFEENERYGLFENHAALLKEKRLHQTIQQIKEKYGKSAIIRGMNLQKNATTLKRNKLIGGHHE